MCVCVCVSESVCVCFLAVYNKPQAQRISNREFKLWTFLRGTESRVATFLAETCVMSHQSGAKIIPPFSSVQFWMRYSLFCFVVDVYCIGSRKL